MFLLFAQSINPDMLADRGILGVLSLIFMYVIRAVALRYADVLEKRASKAEDDLKLERQELDKERETRQEHHEEITKAITDLVKTVAELSLSVSKQQLSIDQLVKVVASKEGSK